MIPRQKVGLYFQYSILREKMQLLCISTQLPNEGIDKFVQYLLKELELFSEEVKSKIEVDTIFFGGGTPSLLLPNQFEKIFNLINSIFRIGSDAEITIEANPGTIDVKHLREFHQMGINRISFGVQSFNDNELQFLDRIHTSQEAIQSIEFAHSIGFNNVSIDFNFLEYPIKRFRAGKTT